MNITLLIILLLVGIIVGLIFYNLKIYRKIKDLSNTNDMINDLRVVQDFINTIGKDEPVENKIETINSILIDKFEIKYSSIIVFNGAEYVIKASNVDEKHWDALKNLHTQDIFKDSIMTATPKYVTINNENEKLDYQHSEFGRAKSAMFFPLYIDNIYIGYWIIESNKMHDFDKLDTNILGIVKENIVSVIKSISYQSTIENIYRIDKTTNLFSAEYLYGKGKRLIDNYPQSTVCMFSIINIEKINEVFERNIGTEIIIRITNLIKTKISSQYIFVRYMGPKFAIVFSGVDSEGTVGFLEEIKKDIEKIKIEVIDKKKKIYATPRINIVVSTYYKGTGIEEVTKKLEEYLDEVDKKESNINYI